MRVLILGIDGYLGWPTALRMIARGHQVYGMSYFFNIPFFVNLEYVEISIWPTISPLLVKNFRNRGSHPNASFKKNACSFV